MREIIFRGKRADNGEWVEGYYALQYDCHKIFLPSTDGEYGFDNYLVIPETVGQYTGLTDKNGTMMSEDDIVTGLFVYGNSIKAVVDFRNGAFGLVWKRGEVEHFDAFTSMCNVKYEVIGNIHDNPELLEVAE